MAIPDYQSVMLPLLEYAGDGRLKLVREAVDALGTRFGLTEEELAELLPSGKIPRFRSRVGWARTYLTKAGLLESPKRGQFHITPVGEKVLADRPAQINVAFLEQFPAFVEFRKLRHDSTGDSATQVAQESEATPEEVLEGAYQSIRSELAEELSEFVRKSSPQFFEQLVVDLLVKMGYGGSRREAGKAIGRSGDEGIDGIINEDRLGLDVIYLQAKRWDSVVGRPEVQKFAGALQGQRAQKGIMITTSGFTRDATEYVKNINTKIILIDGQKLADLMIEHSVGVTTEAIYELKRIDSDYFLEG